MTIWTIAKTDNLNPFLIIILNSSNKIISKDLNQADQVINLFHFSLTPKTEIKSLLIIRMKFNIIIFRMKMLTKIIAIDHSSNE